MEHFLLSKQGGDRATAYVMSNKIVELADGFLCTWIDSRRINQWGLVDKSSGQVIAGGAIGEPCVDNHSGAALALAGDAVHAVTGGHMTPFRHYRMKLDAIGEWNHCSTIEIKGTYPCAVSAPDGRLHLSFRAPGQRWTMNYCRFEDEQWSPEQPLVTARKTGYIYWTNGMAVAPDGALHIVFGNTRVREDGSLFYGASHMASRDAGRTWRDDNDVIVPPAAPAETIPLMVNENDPSRVQNMADQQAHVAAGPRHFHYQQILLSNPVLDRNGALHAVLHNGLTGTADMMSLVDGKWSARPLTAAATAGHAGSRVHLQSSLSLGPGDTLYSALMIEQTDEFVWGPPGTHIVLVTLKTNGGAAKAEQLTKPDPALAQWLPALAHPAGLSADRVPPLLYTRGINAGGFDNNKNAVETEVRLCYL